MMENDTHNDTFTSLAAATARAASLLELKQSTRLFRLGSADLITKKVSFPGSGPNAVPGVITMHIDDTRGRDVDHRLDGVLVVFNASPDTQSISIAALKKKGYTLSSIQARGDDSVVKQTRWNAAKGEVTVPARTVAVLVDAQGRR